MTKQLFVTVLLLLSMSAAFSQPQGGFGENAPVQDFATNKEVPHGEVKTVTYFSKTYHTQRNLLVYTPPGYEAAEGKFPVLYLIHGGGGSETTWTSGGKAQFVLDNLIAGGNAKPMIVVMPDGGGVQKPGNGNRPGGGGPGGFNNPDPAAMAERANSSNAVRSEFINDLLTSIIPYTDSAYRIQTGATSRAIAGFSYGGAEALWAGVQHPETFAWVGVFSMGIQGGSKAGAGGIAGSGSSLTPSEFVAANASFFKSSKTTNKQMKLIWIGSGSEDNVVANGPKQLSESLTAQKIKHEYHETSGGHDMTNWRQYLHDFALLLFR